MSRLFKFGRRTKRRSRRTERHGVVKDEGQEEGKETKADENKKLPIFHGTKKSKACVTNNQIKTAPQSAHRPLLSSFCSTHLSCKPSLYTFRNVCWQRDLLTSRIDWPMLLQSVFSRLASIRAKYCHPRRGLLWCANYIIVPVPRSGTAQTSKFGFKSLSEHEYVMFGSTMHCANTLAMQYYQMSRREALSTISEAVTPVVTSMKSFVFWDVTQCSLEGTCRLHLQDRRIIQARKQREAGVYGSTAKFTLQSVRTIHLLCMPLSVNAFVTLDTQ
jgi:hypothetical protein